MAAIPITCKAGDKNGVSLQVHTLKNVCIFNKQSARYAVFVTALLDVSWPVAEIIVGWL